MIVIIFLLLIVVAVLILLLNKKVKEIRTNEVVIKRSQEALENYKNQYKGIISVDEAIEARNTELKTIGANIDSLQGEFDKKKELLNQDYIGKRNIYESLLSEISVLEENLEDISYGLYKPHYNYNTSEEYKQKLVEIWSNEKEMIKSEKAIFSPTEWSVNGSKVEGRKMIKQNSKLMLRAFNGECDSAIARVNWNNIGTM